MSILNLTPSTFIMMKVWLLCLKVERRGWRIREFKVREMEGMEQRLSEVVGKRNVNT